MALPPDLKPLKPWRVFRYRKEITKIDESCRFMGYPTLSVKETKLYCKLRENGYSKDEASGAMDETREKFPDGTVIVREEYR